MRYWRAGMREAFGMGSAFITLNLPLSIVYAYHPESRQWSLMVLLAIPGVILPAMTAITRLFRANAHGSVMAASCVVGAVIAAVGNHAVVTALTHIGIYLGDRVGTTRLPAPLRGDLSFWKKYFAEQPHYWLPNPKDVFDLILVFGAVAAFTAGWHLWRQRSRSLDNDSSSAEPPFANVPRQHTSRSLKMPV